jgi:thioester reductase-like protein
MALRTLGSTTNPETIAVVGSTGFLGPYIVSALLRKHTQISILCLNRSDDGEQPELAIIKSSKSEAEIWLA